LALQCSGVARGSGAWGQGILTAPPEKFLKFFPSVTKNLFLSLKISDDRFLVITQFFLINHYSLQHTGFAPLYPILFFRPLYKIFTPIFVKYYEKPLKILFWSPILRPL